MAQESFLEILQCPYCGGRFELERREPAAGPHVEFGILRCSCYRYGIVLGIVVIRQYSPAYHNKDPIVAELDRRAYGRAVQLLLVRDLPPAATRRTALSRAAEWIGGGGQRGGGAAPSENGLHPSENLHAALMRLRPNSYGEYLYYRHANPSLLAALPVLAGIASNVEMANATGSGTDPTWSIDFGCGIGHAAYYLKGLLPQTRMVAADLDFLNLLFARRYFLPDASLLCFDAEAGLPFRDGVFRTAFSLDCVHYIRGKHALAKELRRIGRPDALYAIAHLHNANRSNLNPGLPLAAEGYAKVFEPLDGCLYSEATALESFCGVGSLSLDAAAAAACLSTADAFMYISAGKETHALSSRRLDRYMAQGRNLLALNPLYSAERPGGRPLQLRLRWPSEKLRDECCVGFQPLQEKVKITPADAEALLACRLSDLPA